jgi:hypothetical protein
MNDKKFEPPLSITIPVPFDEPRRHGIYSSKHPDSTIAYARLNKFESELINQICQDLNLKLGTFMKFCAVRVAQELDRQKNDYQQSNKPR